MATQMSNLFGRTVIETSELEITRDNLADVLDDASQVHDNNVNQIDYLYGYYCGDQAILSRQKEYNTDINNMVVENHAKEIADFWTGYLMGEPIQYIGVGDSDTEKIALLNKMMAAEDKDSVDAEIAEWQNICGTAYRLCLPNEAFAGTVEEVEQGDEIPFEICSLDPRQTFVIYSSGVRKTPLAGVYYVVDDDDQEYYTVYTKDKVFKTLGTDEIIEESPNNIGMIPIIEYPANTARLGSFEPVLSMLDAINTIDSNRMDGIEQFIQALIVFTNAEIEEGVTAQTIKEKGLLCLKKTNDFQQSVDILAKELNQQQTQVLKDDMYKAILTICSMPNRNGGSSTSDTGVAVIYRDGWSSAETAAKKKEMFFKKSERQFLKVALHICGTMLGTDMTFDDVEVKFTRRNYENISSKATVLTQMLGNEKIDPKLAFIYSNLFPDPEEAYQMSLPYIQGAEKVQNQATENDSPEKDVK